MLPLISISVFWHIRVDCKTSEECFALQWSDFMWETNCLTENQKSHFLRKQKAKLIFKFVCTTTSLFSIIFGICLVGKSMAAIHLANSIENLAILLKFNSFWNDYFLSQFSCNFKAKLNDKKKLVISTDLSSSFYFNLLIQIKLNCQSFSFIFFFRIVVFQLPFLFCQLPPQFLQYFTFTRIRLVVSLMTTMYIVVIYVIFFTVIKNKFVFDGKYSLHSQDTTRKKEPNRKWCCSWNICMKILCIRNQ